MMKLTVGALTVAAAAGLSLTACGSAPSHQAVVAKPQTAASAPSSTAPVPAAGAPLTLAQSRARYAALINPSNALLAVADNDIADAQPWPQTASDLHAAVNAEISANQQIAAVHWAPAVAPYISAEVATFNPSVVACYGAQVQSGSNQGAINATNENAACQLSGASTVPDQIRTILNLPSRG